MLEYPLSEQDKGIISGTQFGEIKARIFKGGLPVFTVARDITINKPTQGEMWVENISGSMYVRIYYNGVKYSSTFL